ncbi:MAG: ankyrin repeat domain-containing protein [Elusimicrobiota bacterium]|nr:ankyrin repeat domain-containing protein [Elusimicrobiota bacterium]
MAALPAAGAAVAEAEEDRFFKKEVFIMNELNDSLNLVKVLIIWVIIPVIIAFVPYYIAKLRGIDANKRKIVACLAVVGVFLFKLLWIISLLMAIFMSKESAEKVETGNNTENRGSIWLFFNYLSAAIFSYVILRIVVTFTIIFMNDMKCTGLCNQPAFGFILIPCIIVLIPSFIILSANLSVIRKKFRPNKQTLNTTIPPPEQQNPLNDVIKDNSDNNLRGSLFIAILIISILFIAIGRGYKLYNTYAQAKIHKQPSLVDINSKDAIGNTFEKISEIKDQLAKLLENIGYSQTEIAEVKKYLETEKINESNKSPLVESALADAFICTFNPEMTEFLLRHKVNVDKTPDKCNRGRKDWTPLMNAAYHENKSDIKMLLDANADANLTDAEGDTALDLVISNRKSFTNRDAKNIAEIIKMLQPKTNRQVNEAYVEYELKGIPLLYASNVKEIKKALQSGADVNYKDSIGRTVLWHACFDRKMDIAKELIKAGADPNIKDVNGSLLPCPRK